MLLVVVTFSSLSHTPSRSLGANGNPPSTNFENPSESWKAQKANLSLLGESLEFHLGIDDSEESDTNPECFEAFVALNANDVWFIATQQNSVVQTACAPQNKRTPLYILYHSWKDFIL